MGVKLHIIEHGDGVSFPKQGDKVVIHYIGRDDKGRVFDNSYDRPEPFETEIGTGKVIKGWDEGIIQLSKGEKARLTVSPEFAYGSLGYPPVIYPNSTLIFEIWLIDIKRKKTY